MVNLKALQDIEWKARMRYRPSVEEEEKEKVCEMLNNLTLKLQYLYSEHRKGNDEECRSHSYEKVKERLFDGILWDGSKWVKAEK